MVEGAKIYLPRCSLEHIQDRGEAQAGLTRHQRRRACYAGVWAETRCLGACTKHNMRAPLNSLENCLRRLALHRCPSWTSGKGRYTESQRGTQSVKPTSFYR